MNDAIYTIGHSTHSHAEFRALLEMHSITAVGDVRSRPYSRMAPHFNKPALKEFLKRHGIGYVYLGHELGGRPADRACYVEGRANYEKVAATALFRAGLDRVQQGMEHYRIALMCAEKEPLNCHRTLLVGRRLAGRGVKVLHILEDGRVEEHSAVEERLLQALGLPESDMFTDKRGMIEFAYGLQAGKMAYEDDGAELPAGL